MRDKTRTSKTRPGLISFFPTFLLEPDWFLELLSSIPLTVLQGTSSSSSFFFSVFSGAVNKKLLYFV